MPTVSSQTASTRVAPGAGSGAPIVACQSLMKVFRDFWMRSKARAVDNVTFEVRPGEIFGLLGPNGSGKSTTIKILLGLLHRTSGRVAVFGKSPTDVSIKRRIGYLPEESYLYAFLNARETLDYYGKLFELDRSIRTRRIDELLEMVGLEGAQYRPVREYSKGMQRRIGLAQALINDPELLILDEPTTGLDPIGTRQVKDLILELGRRGKTVILSSHLLADVEDCVDRMVVLYGGKIRAEGTCDDLLTTTDKSILEFEPLDDATISRVDQVVRESSGGGRSLLRVSRPRQKLEDLFVDIVNRARAERAETSGAQHGGQTAAFLKAEPEGAALIERLSAASDEPRRASTPAPTAPIGPDDDVLRKLTEQPPAAPGAAATSPAPKAPSGPPKPFTPGSDVDRGVIGSLLDDDEPAGGKGTSP
jgi:ABC-2 type transport system ATP-binding protein